MRKNVGKKITNFFCEGNFGRRYDLEDSIIEAEGKDWIVIRIPDGSADFRQFKDKDEKKSFIKKWAAWKV